MKQCRAVFLDRDGVINAMWCEPESGAIDSPKNPSQFKLMPGVSGAIKTLRDRGFLTIIVSNQPGIAKGKLTPQMLEEMTQKMHTYLNTTGAEIDAVYYCLHHPQAVLSEYRAVCNCRKPKPGLLLQAAAEWNIDLESSYMIG